MQTKQEQQTQMSLEECEEILFPKAKPMTFEEGFELYKKFYGQPIECGTTLEVEGYPPRHIHGFSMWVKDEKTGEDVPVADRHLMSSYIAILENKTEEWRYI